MAFVMLICVVPIGASAEYAEYTEGYYTYTVYSGEASIIDCDESISGDVEIPSTLGGYPVVRIGRKAFYNCNDIISLVIPEGVEEIESGHYEENFWETIIYSAFFGCKSLESVLFPSSLIYIGAYAFMGCNKLKNITFATEGKLAVIGSYAFYSCSGVEDFDIPDSVDDIGEEAFSYCTSLTSIIIPCSVTNIDDSAFAGCNNLEKVEVSGENPVYHSNGNCIIDTSKKRIILGCKNSLIPSDGSVISIGNHAFTGCSGLKNITIPDEIIEIEDYAFCNCTALTNVTIGNGVSDIGWGAFLNCTGLTSVTIPNSVSGINWDAFYNCTELTSITIPKSVGYIGNKAFGYYLSPSSGMDEKIQGFIIYGYPDTTSEFYANENGFTFIPLDEEHKHTFGEWTITTTATCTDDGEEFRICLICDEVETRTLVKKGHSDLNNDGKCDICGTLVGISDKPSQTCTHICHKTGISRFFYKIARFFWKLFKINKECSCGAAHY